MVVVEDSPSVTLRITSAIRRSEALELAGTASTAEEAVEVVRRERPHVVSMDVRLKGERSGIDACRDLMAVCPTPIVLVTSLSEAPEVPFEGLRAGAMTIINKNRVLEDEDGLDDFVRRLQLFAGIETVTLRPPRAPEAAPTREAAPTGPRAAAVGIVASTGGPPVLQEIVRALPAGLQGPILIAIHIQPDFLDRLATWLDKACPLPVRLGMPGITAAPGEVYLAPAVGALTIDRARVLGFDMAPKTLEAGDRMLASMADAFGRRAAGLVLTGMARDGARGLEAVRKGGGLTAVQRPETATLRSMPDAARPYAQDVLEVSDVARWIGQALVPRS